MSCHKFAVTRFAGMVFMDLRETWLPFRVDIAGRLDLENLADRDRRGDFADLRELVFIFSSVL